MISLTKTLATMVAGTALIASVFAQSAEDIRGKTPFIPVGTEPPAQLIVDPPNPLALSAAGVVLIQYRTENVHIVPVFGPSALSIFTRVGHLHINVDNLPWHWADASDNLRSLSRSFLGTFRDARSAFSIRSWRVGQVNPAVRVPLQNSRRVTDLVVLNNGTSIPIVGKKRPNALGTRFLDTCRNRYPDDYAGIIQANRGRIGRN